ncbi:GGDEF domain-containing protein [Cellulomonas sp. ATA003]|nr:GGDEF domain-containing protein [Cellulomonas sp. ATA003]WNB85064.1 GGDEF domain-containing protein [Cellulomonas sp. ATA003]
MTERFDHLLAAARDEGRPLSVVLLDIDRFKLVNDRYGHLAGDAVLVEAARRIARVAPPVRWSRAGAARSSSSRSPGPTARPASRSPSGCVAGSRRRGSPSTGRPCRARSAVGWRRSRRPAPRRPRSSTPPTCRCTGRRRRAATRC